MWGQTVKAASAEQGQGDLAQHAAGGAEETTWRAGHADTRQKGAADTHVQAAVTIHVNNYS